MSVNRKMRKERGEPRIAMVLQGGGALGSYQVGVYQALEEAGYLPSWDAGMSIGAINAALIVGNPPGERLARMKAFWDRVTRPGFWPMPSPDGEIGKLYKFWGSFQAAVLGQPGFFKPRLVNPWFAPPGSPGALSYYDTGPLGETLEDLIDFDLVNSDAHRLSLGAVEVTTGRQVYFDSTRQRLRVEHILASAALPPGFPPVEIEGKTYWDGGILSNTPLDVVLDDMPRVSTLVFMADVFDPEGPVPRTMDDVLKRRKDITYASRSDCHIHTYETVHNLRRVVNDLWSRLPAETQADPEVREMGRFGCTTTMNIVHFIYRGAPDDTAAKDYNFSRTAIERHRAVGHRDAAREVEARPWAKPAPPHVGVIVHKVAATPE